MPRMVGQPSSSTGQPRPRLQYSRWMFLRAWTRRRETHQASPSSRIEHSRWRCPRLVCELFLEISTLQISPSQKSFIEHSKYPTSVLSRTSTGSKSKVHPSEYVALTLPMALGSTGDSIWPISRTTEQTLRIERLRNCTHKTNIDTDSKKPDS